jgi:hypothetical protein
VSQRAGPSTEFPQGTRARKIKNQKSDLATMVHRRHSRKCTLFTRVRRNQPLKGRPSLAVYGEMKSPVRWAHTALRLHIV